MGFTKPIEQILLSYQGTFIVSKRYYTRGEFLMNLKKKDIVLKRFLMIVLVFALILGSLPTYHVYAEEIEGASETSNGDASEGNNEGVSGNYTDGLIDGNGMIIKSPSPTSALPV